MLVRINAGAVMRPASARLDRSLLAKDNACTADRELPEMDELPIRHRPIDRQILRHRTEHDAVARRHTTHRQWAKQQRAFSDWRSKAAWMLGNNLNAGNMHFVLSLAILRRPVNHCVFDTAAW